MAVDETRDAGDAVVDEAPGGWGVPGPVQEQLPLDEPVPFRLTTRGRRVVAPQDVPALEVVVPSGAVPQARPVDLDADGLGTARVRARALRRAGAYTLEIAEELGVEPLHVEAWVEDLPAPVVGTRHRPGRRGLRVVRDVDDADREAAARALAAQWQQATEQGRRTAAARLAAEPALRAGLGLVAGALEPDRHALVLAGDQVPLLAAAWHWVLTTLEPGDVPLRVLVRHDPDDAGDRVAHRVAEGLGTEVSRVATTRDPARRGRRPHVRLRVSDVELAGRVLGWQEALLAEVAGDAG